MFLVDLLGALLTLAAFSFLGLSGYLAAVALLGERARRDSLALAVAWGLSSLSIALLIGLLLGAIGQLRIDLALSGLALLTILQLQRAKKTDDPWGPAHLLGRRTWAHLAERPALAILTVHAAGSELLRGLLRPPLSWDSLMYHLLLTATWLQENTLAPVFGPAPTNFYGFQPGNGSLWFWWWMAPSHSEFWVNLGSALPWLLLGLAAGAVARQLGAEKSWPVAAYLTLLTPCILRFIGAQYVDLLVGAGIAAAACFSMLWLDEARWGTALLAGAGLGIAAGAKVLALPYVLAFAGALLLAAAFRGGWRVRTGQILAAIVIASLLGGFWYVRNLAYGAGPLGLRCEGTAAGAQADRGEAPTIPRPNSVLDQFGVYLRSGQLVDATLGVTRPPSLELGLGPQVFLLLPLLAFPLGLPRGRRRAAFLIWSQVAAQTFVWLTVPYADRGTIFANIRYLDGALALALAGGVVLLELRAVAPRWIEGIALVLAAQGLLQLHSEMPRGVRLAMAAVDLAVVVLALSPILRNRIRERAPTYAVAAVVLLLGLAPILAGFRAADRGRAMALDLSVHKTPVELFARAWSWLDHYGENGTVAVASSPQHFFVYPAMGPRLERKAIFANVNAADFSNAAAYPACDPRVDLNPEAWLTNLGKHEVRWLHLMRYPGTEYLPERAWADALPGRFTLRYEDDANRIYEVSPPPGS
ncbi:MAG TPA: hypothetical protein VGS22_23185 [Thermoanaerobaculia bacterium]|jgi:hypothetical protein|nr:hypothetical protein [Thermoanaerobaculia bacterium]